MNTLGQLLSITITVLGGLFLLGLFWLYFDRVPVGQVRAKKVQVLSVDLHAKPMPTLILKWEDREFKAYCILKDINSLKPGDVLRQIEFIKRPFRNGAFFIITLHR